MLIFYLSIFRSVDMCYISIAGNDCLFNTRFVFIPQKNTYIIIDVGVFLINYLKITVIIYNMHCTTYSVQR